MKALKDKPQEGYRWIPVFEPSKDSNGNLQYVAEKEVLRELNSYYQWKRMFEEYSPENGRIKVRAEFSKNPEYIEVSVEDQGCGIPEEHQKKLFERFYRVENNTHTVKGTGLGLHLVKITVEKHHQGEVFVQSKPGDGSKFGFRLPINPVESNEEDV